MKLKIIYEDENTLVVEKPPFLVTFSKDKKEESLSKILLKKFPYLKKLGEERRCGIVHRLDKEASGIILVAKNKEYYDFFQKQFKERKVGKKYLVLIKGKIIPKERTVEVYLARGIKDKRKQTVFSPTEPKAKGKKLKKAILSYKVLKEFNNFSLVEVDMKTGRKHQIRAIFFWLGHPVAGDKLYKKRRENKENLAFPRLFLHSSLLMIKLPNGNLKEFRSPLPQDLQKILEKLK